VEAADGHQVVCMSQLMIDMSSSKERLHIVTFVQSQVRAHMCEEKTVTERRRWSSRLKEARKR
jgi:hypothetical protein